MITRKKGSSIVIACLAALLALVSVSATQAAPAAPITGDITFVGLVSLDTASAGSANTVTLWSGLAPGNLPQVEDRDGSFSAFVTPGDGVTFHAPWTLSSGPIMNFWSVDGFKFDLTSSTVFRTANSVSVSATGVI